MEKRIAIAAAAISLGSTTLTIAAHADAAPSSHCSSSREKVVLSCQPDQAHAQTTCNTSGWSQVQGNPHLEYISQRCQRMAHDGRNCEDGDPSVGWLHGLTYRLQRSETHASRTVLSGRSKILGESLPC